MLARLAAVLFVLPLFAAAADAPPQPVTAVTVDDGVTVAIATVEENHTDILAVMVDGALIWAQTGYILQFGAPPGQDIAPGTDITGSGVPELLVAEYSGGAHCCTTYYLYAFKPYFRLLTTIPTLDAGARFEDLDGRPGLEAITADMTFAYWNTYYAASPKPRVVLAWNGSAYVAAPDLMATPAPDEADLDTQAAAVAASDQWTADTMDPDLWRTMLDLIYGGHADLAWRFLDAAWPTNRDGKETFRTDFLCQLATSPWWNTIATMDSLEAPVDCPAAN